jgi:hypothetical protein
VFRTNNKTEFNLADHSEATESTHLQTPPSEDQNIFGGLPDFKKSSGPG